MPAKPVSVCETVLDSLEPIRVLVHWVDFQAIGVLGNAFCGRGWGAMGDYEIAIPTCLIKRLNRSCALLLVGHLFGEPCFSQDPVLSIVFA